MSIASIDQLIAGLRPPENFFKVGSTMEAAGVLHSLLYSPGFPGAGVANGQALAGAALTSYSGSFPYTNPGAGNGYLARLAVAATQPGVFYLVDRLWHNDTIAETTTTGQTINSATWPARDRDGSTNGESVMVGIEVSTATTNGSPVTNTTLTYTNSGGTGSRTATIASFPATAVAGTFVPFELQGGDTGVRSIQTLTLGTSYGGGTIHLVAYRVLARVSIGGASGGAVADFAQLGLPRLYDNTVPCGLWLPNATTAVTVHGQITYAHG